MTHPHCDEEPRLACVTCHFAHVAKAEAEGVTFKQWVEAQGKRVGGKS
jgi:hypothetical protein